MRNSIDSKDTDVLPLTSSSGAFSLSTIKRGDSSASFSLRKSTSFSTTKSTSDAQVSSSYLIRSTVFSLVVGLVGWYFPRYLIETAKNVGQHYSIPVQKTASGDVILDFLHNQPLVDPPTIPSNLLVWMSVWVPVLFIAVVATFAAHQSSSRSNRFLDLHSGVCGFITAIGVSEGATQILKLYIQRRRPNFFALCGFQANMLQCTAPLNKIKEANFSFPSGHSSLSACAMTFVALYLVGKIAGHPALSTSQKRFFGLFSTVIPLGWSLFVGASRIVDQWHHPSDVLAGLMLGSISAVVVYHAWYMPLSTNPGTPWSCCGTESKAASFSE